MKKYLRTGLLGVGLSILVFALFFSDLKAQVTNIVCPQGYTCIPLTNSIPNCPVGYTCTPKTTLSIQTASCRTGFECEPPKNTTPSKVNTDVKINASLLDTNEDRVGIWNSFEPGKGNVTGRGDDWNWKLELTFLKNPKKVKRVSVLSPRTGEMWSTGYSRYAEDGTDLIGRVERPYPLVMRVEKVGPGSGSWYQINSKYDQELYIGGSTASLNVVNEFMLYGQKESSKFYGGKVRVDFEDGSHAVADISEEVVKTTPSMVCPVGFTCRPFNSTIFSSPTPSPSATPSSNCPQGYVCRTSSVSSAPAPSLSPTPTITPVPLICPAGFTCNPYNSTVTTSPTSVVITSLPLPLSINTPFTIKGTSSNKEGQLTVAIVGPSYSGGMDWNTISNTLKGNGKGVASSVKVENGNWSAKFGGLGSTGQYYLFVYNNQDGYNLLTNAIFTIFPSPSSTPIPTYTPTSANTSNSSSATNALGSFLSNIFSR